MTGYKLNVQPGKVVKETYKIEYEQIVDASAPAVNGQFVAPYVAKVELPLGQERVNISTNNNGEFNASYRMRGNNTVKKLGNLAKLLYKITVSECGAILSNTKESVVKYDGLPQEAKDAVKDAEDQFYKAFSAYTNALEVPGERTVVTKRQTLNITPTAVNVDTETLNDRL